MAAKRKRGLRGLGGTPEHHARQFAESSSHAQRMFSAAKESSAKNQCWQALSFIVSGAEASGQMIDHDIDAITESEVLHQNFPRDQKRSRVLNLQREAVGAFSASCIYESKHPRPLSGLAGRRRRR